MDGSDVPERDFVARVRAAQERLRGRVSPTVLIPMTVSVRDGDGEVEVTVAYEGHQEPGSFLFRAAYLSVLDTPPDRTIVCASRGSFAAAVACAARREGRKAVVFVPETTPRANMAAIGRQRPHELRRASGSFHEVEQAAQTFAQRPDTRFVSGYDDEWALIGAGTLAAELLAEVPDITEMLVPTGGGGLLGGMAEYFGDRLRVASVETQNATSMMRALQAGEGLGRPIQGAALNSLAIPNVGTRGLDAARRWRAQPVVVSNRAASVAARWLWKHHDLPVDPGTAAPLAALTGGRYGVPPDARTVVVVSGSIVSPSALRD